LRRGHDVRSKAERLFESGNNDPAIARILGTTANCIGAVDLGVPTLTETNATLRAQGRLSDLARVLFAQGWAEMEVGDWGGAMREAEEGVGFGEETNGTLWIAGARILMARLAGMQDHQEQFEAHAARAERLLLSI